MSTNQLQTVPSVLLVIKLCAFCVPTICIAYTGCVCPAADNGVLRTGRCFERVSHRRICPEYVPPNRRFEWKGENVTESTSDCLTEVMSRALHWKMESLLVSERRIQGVRGGEDSKLQRYHLARLERQDFCCTMRH